MKHFLIKNHVIIVWNFIIRNGNSYDKVMVKEINFDSSFSSCSFHIFINLIFFNMKLWVHYNKLLGPPISVKFHFMYMVGKLQSKTDEPWSSFFSSYLWELWNTLKWNYKFNLLLQWKMDIVQKSKRNELACKMLYHVNAKRRRLKYMHFIFYLNDILANKLLKTLWPFKTSIIIDQIVKLNQNKSTKWKYVNSLNENLLFIKIN